VWSEAMTFAILKVSARVRQEDEVMNLDVSFLGDEVQ
jgi:hypothetical protein